MKPPAVMLSGFRLSAPSIASCAASQVSNNPPILWLNFTTRRPRRSNATNVPCRAIGKVTGQSSASAKEAVFIALKASRRAVAVVIVGLRCRLLCAASPPRPISMLTFWTSRKGKCTKK